MRVLIDFIYLLAALAISPIFIYRVIRHKRYRTGWAQRFGKVTRKKPGKKCIWLHAVSVGEVNAAKTIIQELETQFPDFEIVVSTTTDTGFARARKTFGQTLQVFYFPLDVSWTMGRAFRRIRPALCLLMELEVWPNFVDFARKLSVPVVVVNGRISDRSFAKYKKIKPITKAIFCRVTLVLAQTDEYAERFRELGCPAERVVVTGSLKYDTAQITDKVAGAHALAEQLRIGEEAVWVAGATGPGEEKIALDVYNTLVGRDTFKNLRLIIVPRKPERFDEVARLISEAGFDFARYSTLKGTKRTLSEKTPVLLGDTMGDLRKFYSLATIIFVGRSLVPMGGSDMMEAAALGKCTIFGPHAFNFKQTVDALLAENGAIMVADQHELLEVMQRCLNDSAFAQQIANNGRDVIRRNQGATAKTINHIATFLKSAYSANTSIRT